jgi:PKD repeat protein
MSGSWRPRWDDGIWQFFWEFGDGGTYFGGTAYHTYSTGGTFVTTLTVTDNRGASAQDTVTINVGAPNQPPVAVADATPFSGTSPLTVSLSSAGSADADGFITGYLWNFGDGSAPSTEPNPTHVYDRGGLFQATLTVTDNEGGSGTDWVVIDVAQGDLVSVASADQITEAGTVSGSYLDTQTGDGVYQALTEAESNGGKPSKRRSQGSHTWRMSVASGVSYKFFVDAYHTQNSEGDDFAFEYSRDGANFAPMLVVSALAPGGPLQSYVFTENVSGTLYVRATDTDRTQGNRALDTLYVDEMFVVSSMSSGGDTTPPAAPAGLAATAGDGSVSLDWANNAEPDLAGYSVYRATSAGGPYTRLTATPLAPSAYTDTAVTNGTTYYYVATASDGSGNESLFSTEDSATPQATGAATTMHVSAILLSGENAGKGAKQGRATVTVLDDLGNPISGATVTGTFSGDLNETRSATTNASGVAVLTSVGSAKRLSFGFCVDGVTGPLDYDPAANGATCSTF